MHGISVSYEVVLKKNKSKKKKVVSIQPSLQFVKQYRHAKTGKMMIAADYGYKAWPIGRRKAA